MIKLASSILFIVLLCPISSSGLQDKGGDMPQPPPASEFSTSGPEEKLPAESTDSYRESLEWYKRAVDLARSAGKDCPEPPPIPTFMPTSPLDGDREADSLQDRWANDVGAIRKEKDCPEPSEPPIPTFSTNPEALRTEWEDFRVSIEKLRKDLGSEVKFGDFKNRELTIEGRKIYKEGLDIYWDGIAGYKILAKERKEKKNGYQ